MCGQRWIRTTEGVSQQIYSLPHLATLVFAHISLMPPLMCARSVSVSRSISETGAKVDIIFFAPNVLPSFLAPRRKKSDAAVLRAARRGRDINKVRARKGRGGSPGGFRISPLPVFLTGRRTYTEGDTGRNAALHWKNALFLKSNRNFIQL